MQVYTIQFVQCTIIIGIGLELVSDRLRIPPVLLSHMKRNARRCSWRAFLNEKLFRSIGRGAALNLL